MKEVKEQEFVNMTKEEFKEKYPNLSKEDVDFYFPTKKVLDFKVDFVSVRKYEYLIEKRKEYNNYNFQNPTKEQKHLSEIELLQINSFQSKNQQSESEKFENRIAYWNKVLSNEKSEQVYIDGILPDKKTIYKCFLISYKFLNGVDFIINEETLMNIEPIIKYFSFDKTYFDCDNVIKKVGNKDLTPSFEKGLLLVGNFGNGKTSVMKAMSFMIDYYLNLSKSENWNTSGDWNRIKFKFKTTEELVTEFEYLETQELKDNFFKTNSKHNIFLDDLKKEKNASNYGITNVVGSILEKRYNNLKNYTNSNFKKNRTHGTLNYHKDYPNDVGFAIQECGVRYGNHIYDRIFEMFNIIEFKGKSFRR